MYFSFYKNAQFLKKVSISGFTFKYLGVWESKYVEYIGAPAQTFITEPGESAFSSYEVFRLNDGNIIKSGESIKAEVRQPGTEQKNDNYVVTVLPIKDVINFSIENKTVTEMSELTESIDIYFEISYGTEIKWRGTFANFKYTHTPGWETPVINTIGFEGETHVVCLNPGDRQVTLTPTDSQYFELDRELVGSEELDEEVICSNNFLKATASLNTTNRRISVTFDIDPTSEGFDIYTSKTYSTTLKFTFKNGSFKPRSQEIFNKTFVIEYVPIDLPEEYNLLMNKEFTTLKGEKLLTLPASVAVPQPEGDEWLAPEVSIKGTSATSWTMADGSVIQLNTTKSLENYSGYGFVSFFFDITNLANGDYEAETFTNIEFDVRLSDPQGREQRTKDIHIKIDTIHYTPYTHAQDLSDPYEYIADRTLSIASGRKTDTLPLTQTYVTKTATAWIVGKTYPNDPTDLKYNLVVKWSDKKDFEDMRNQFNVSGYDYHIGFSNSDMTENTEKGPCNITTEDYMYIKPNSVTMLTDDESDSTTRFIVETNRLFGSGDWGAEVNVMTVDFGDPTENNDYRNIEHTRDIHNQLARIEAYAKDGTGRKRTNLLSAPVETVTGWSNYEVYFAGFGVTSVKYYSEDEITAPYWHNIEIDSSALAYYNAGDDFLSGSNTITSNVIHRACTYQYQKSISSGAWFDGEGGGSMLIVRNKTDNQFYVAGLYSGDGRGTEGQTIRNFDVFWWSSFTYWYVYTHTVNARNMLTDWNN